LSAVAALSAFWLVDAGSARAESCHYDSGTKTVTAEITPGASATLKVVGVELWFGLSPVPCGAATTSNTDTMNIAGGAGSIERLVLDQRTGLFAPGATPEGGGISEIEFATTLGDADDTVLVYLTDDDDRVAPGQNGLGLNADGDADVTFSPGAFPLEIRALGGADYVNGRGEFGAGLAFLGPLTIDGGPGSEELLRGSFADDRLSGGDGDDEIEGNDGADVIDGGAGDDILRAGSGDDDVTGGPGSDTFIGVDGDDIFRAADGEADGQMNGGPGADTAYYDSALDPAPAFVEILLPELTPPLLDCDSPDGAWHGTDVAIECTAEDPESGIPDPDDQTFNLTTSVTDGTETADAATGTRQICNGAGLCTTAGPIRGNMVDRKPPAVACDSAIGAWSRLDASIACTAADGGSGLADPAQTNFSLFTNVPDGTETSNGLTNSQEVCDNVGNCIQAGPIGGNKIDKKGPAVACGSAIGAWSRLDATIACTAADGGSGLADPAQTNFSLFTSIPDGTEASNGLTNSQEVCDNVGYCVQAGPIGGNKVDKKAPRNPSRIRSTDHRKGRPSSDRRITVAFGAGADAGSGVDGFSFTWTKRATSAPDRVKDREERARGVTSPRLGNGRWFFHLRTRDNVGNWSAPVHLGPFPLR